MIYDILFEFYTISNLYEEMGINQIPSSSMFITNLLETLLIFLAYFSFRGFALYKMATNRGLNHAKYAFIPFMALILANELMPESPYMEKYKKIGLATVIVLACYFALNLLLDCLFAIKPLKYLFNDQRLTEEILSNGNALLRLLNLFTSLLNIAYYVLCIILFTNVFKAYAPFKSKKYSILSAIVLVVFNTNLLFAIFLYTLRNRPVSNYGEFVNMKNAYMGYGNGYYRDNYNSNNYERHSEQSSSGTTEDPFGEFNNGKQGDPFENFNNGGNNNDNNNDDGDGLF